MQRYITVCAQAQRKTNEYGYISWITKGKSWGSHGYTLAFKYKE